MNRKLIAIFMSIIALSFMNFNSQYVFAESEESEGNVEESVETDTSIPVEEEVQQESATEDSNKEEQLEVEEVEPSEEQNTELQENDSELEEAESEQQESAEGDSQSKEEKEQQESDTESIQLFSSVEVTPYTIGDSGQHVVEMKEKLVKLGFAKWKNPSAIYGEVTAGVVEDFQSYYDLPVTGEADETTRKKMDEVLNPPYKNKDRGQPVVELKEDLVKLGFANWKNPSQFYGNVTANVVKDFQRAFGLTANGVADASTLAKMEEILNNSIRVGDTGQHVVDVKEDLVKLGFAKWKNPSAVYGNITAGVVEDFQSYYELPVSGIVDARTLNKIAEVLNPPYKNGDRGEPVVKLKEDLVKLGFANWKSPSQFYGTVTANVVKDFQDAYGLTVDGIAGSSTLAKIDELLNESIRIGETGQHIVEIKEDLVKLGFAKWKNPSAVYGKITAGVVEDFQSYYDLPVSGIVDTLTLNKIAEVLNPPYKNGDRGEPVVDLKEDLVKLGFANWKNPSQFYGNVTANVVKDFQSYYDLPVNGVADETTLNKMKEVLNPPYKNGDRGEPIVKLKEDLVELGFANWRNPSQFYGNVTANVVKDFQEVYGLEVTGVADDTTLATIAEAINTKEVVIYSPYDISLEDALALQMEVNPQTDKYRNNAAYVYANYVDVKGMITGSVVNLRTSPDLDNNNNVAATVRNGASFTPLDDNVQGDEFNGSTRWYKINYDGDTLYVHSNLANVYGIVNRDKARIREDNNNKSHIFDVVSKDKELNIIEMGNNWHKISYNTWRSAKASDVKEYLDPENFINHPIQKFQFLDLSKPSGVSVDFLNDLLDGKGVLEGYGEYFKKAEDDYNINAIYLVSHATLETGHGTSDLAKGMEYNGKTVHNLFGINAFDNCPAQCGAKKASDAGWTSIEKAIDGGAKWISDNYVNHSVYQQNTIYKMRWNPSYMANHGVASHQYASDIGWAFKQVDLSPIYQQLGSFIPQLDIPVFK